MPLRIALITSCLLLTTPLLAASDLQPGIFGRDDRVPVDNSVAPWSAVGHVNIGGYRRRGLCTGTLVAPATVLTAAHCLIDPVKRKPFPLNNIHFVAGVNKDKSIGSASAKCLSFPKDYHYTGPERLLADLQFQSVPVDSFKLDLALIHLDHEIPAASTAILDVKAVLLAGTPLNHPAYPADKRYVLYADTSCEVSGGSTDLLATTCDTHPGASGGPVFVQTEITPKLAAIMVSIVPGKASLAVPVARWPEMNIKAGCP